MQRGKKLDTRTPWNDESMQKSQERLREWISSTMCRKRIKVQAQNRHVKGTKEYEQYLEEYKEKGSPAAPSYLTKRMAQWGRYGNDKRPFSELQKLVDEYAGRGEIKCKMTKSGVQIIEYLDMPREIGYTVDRDTGLEALTKRVQIRYAKDGVHIVPDKEKANGHR